MRSEILATFQELEWKQRFRLFHAHENPETSPYKVDRSQVVIERNRYQNVQPWDASRVKLKTPICGSDYVNASPIILKSRPSDSSSQEMKYIATQGPKSGQKSHFWHLVHQETEGDTGVVIMLTQLVEDNKEKCAPYFPSDLGNPTMTLIHDETKTNGARADGDPFLDLSSSSDTDDSEGSADSAPGADDTITLLSKEFDNEVVCEVRKFRLTINNVSKTIIHYLFSRWPDFGKPEAEDRKGLIQLSRRSYAEAGNSPRFVHCSAGVGRTGTWIALDFLIREVEEDRLLDSVKSVPAQNGNAALINNEGSKAGTWGKSGPLKVNTPTQEEGFEKDEHDLVFDTVNTLREQRMMMVVRDVQYVFLYEAVKEVFVEKYAAKPEGAVVKEGADIDTLPRHPKAPRISDAGDDDVGSEAETEIIGPGSQQNTTKDEEEDPYAAVSPTFVQQGMK